MQREYYREKSHHPAQRNIGCVTRHRYPTEQEIRITRFGECLSHEGHIFYVLCPGMKNDESSQIFEYGTIVRLKQPLDGPLIRALLAPLPISPIWFLWLFMQFRALRLHILLIRDLRLALPAILAGKLLGLRVILDLGENYPALMKITPKDSPHHYLIRNFWLIKLLEIVCVYLSDKVWVVAEENMRRLKVYAKNITIISNYPAFNFSSIRCSQQTQYNMYGKPVKLIFLGLIDNIRGLDIVIEAFGIVYTDLPNIELHIYGDGFQRVKLEQHAARLALQSRVFFHGWVDGSLKYNILATGDIGLLLHKVCELTQSTIPNKLFDYMSVGLPVIATPIRPIVKIIQGSDCGMIVPDDPKDVARVVKELVQDREKRLELGKNGLDAVRLKYTWDCESKKVNRDIGKGRN